MNNFNFAFFLLIGFVLIAGCKSEPSYNPEWKKLFSEAQSVEWKTDSTGCSETRARLLTIIEKRGEILEKLDVPAIHSIFGPPNETIGSEIRYFATPCFEVCKNKTENCEKKRLFFELDYNQKVVFSGIFLGD